MLKPPPFVKRCSRFPHSVENLEDEFCTPSRCIHRKWGRAYELSMSSEALLKTEKAAELFFNFVRYYRYQFDEDEDKNDKEEEDDEEEDRHFNHRSMIVWLSKDVFITRCGDYTASSSPFDQQPSVSDHGTFKKVYSISFFEYSGGLWIVQQLSLVADVAPGHEVVVDGMDVILRLLAKLETCPSLTIEAKMATVNNDGSTAAFPASLDAFKAFASEPCSPRNISLQLAGLSQVQWNTITAHCNKNVTLRIDYDEERDKSSFIEAAIHYHCPAGLDLAGFQQAPTDKRQLILEGIESSTFVERLHLDFESWNKEAFLSCMKAIARNRSLKVLSLGLYEDDDPQEDDLLTLEEWELIFCPAIASHPMLQDVEVDCDFNFMPMTSPESDDILIKMVSQNTHLFTFVVDIRLLKGDGCEFYSAVDRVLKINCFRPVVQAIKQETNIEHRQQQFTATLLSNNICEHPAHRYLLLKENIDLLLLLKGYF